MRLSLSILLALPACAGSKAETPAPASGQSGEQVRVTGTVTYLQRIAMPDSALVIVRIVDASRADAPAEVMGEARIVTAGRQVPIPFEIALPTARIQANHSYAAQARIEYDGKLRWITNRHFPVLTRGAGNQIALRVDPVTD
jgi:putative lipoprotein